MPPVPSRIAATMGRPNQLFFLQTTPSIKWETTQEGTSTFDRDYCVHDLMRAEGRVAPTDAKQSCGYRLGRKADPHSNGSSALELNARTPGAQHLAGLNRCSGKQVRLFAFFGRRLGFQPVSLAQFAALGTITEIRGAFGWFV